ncbi:hypothetical protein [Rhizobium sp. 18055]|uniref:hypothetical protein n=1 Tax=Rhizobium sp. 18055 TaxID=2681403 RepID=UPI0013586800|nr:hypothetical protein [Rhizobium sp. 18055]
MVAGLPGQVLVGASAIAERRAGAERVEPAERCPVLAQDRVIDVPGSGLSASAVIIAAAVAAAAVIAVMSTVTPTVMATVVSTTVMLVPGSIVGAMSC